MPLSPPAPREKLHGRQVHCVGYRREDGRWDIEGHLVDEKSYGFNNTHRGWLEPGDPVHQMWLRITIDDEMLIHAAEAVTDHAPFAVCPDITPQFRKLEGLRIGPGFRQRVRERLGGTRGCTHLVELLGPMATTAFQTMTAKRLAERKQDPSRRPSFLNTCHAHASDGVVVKQFWPQHYTGGDVASNGEDVA
jgi:hypothetical protein